MGIEDMTREQLLQVVRRLPITGDGVPIVPGMTVYLSDGTSKYVDKIREADWEIGCNKPSAFIDPWWLSGDTVYSTKEAAFAGEPRMRKRPCPECGAICEGQDFVNFGYHCPSCSGGMWFSFGCR